jgi:hypothetical protein
VPDDVASVDLTGEQKVVTDSSGTEHRTRSVILAMGSAYRKLGRPNEECLSGQGASWCATCDGFFFRNQNIVVVDGGDSAVEEAAFLIRVAERVTLVHRRDALRVSKIMQEQAFADPNIEFAWNSEVAEIHGEDSLTASRRPVRAIPTWPSSSRCVIAAIERTRVDVRRRIRGRPRGKAAARTAWTYTTNPPQSLRVSRTRGRCVLDDRSGRDLGLHWTGG